MPLGIGTLPSLSNYFTIISPDRISRSSGFIQHVYHNAKLMNLHTYTPRHLLRPVSNHINIREGIATGSAVGYSPDTRRQFSEWIASGGYDHFVTLASNDLKLRSARRHLIRGRHGSERMVALAKAWEGRVNRHLLGPRWAAPHKRSERLQAFYILERADVNPHWHVLTRIDEPDPAKHAAKISKFREQAGPIWTSIILSGSTNFKDIYDEGVAEYVAKELGRSVSCDLFIPPGFFDVGG